MSDSKVPLYAKVKQKILDRIASGQYKSGDRIDAIGKLTDQLGVGRLTVIKAVEQLSQEGMLKTKPRSGCYVTERAVRLLRPSGTTKTLPEDRTVMLMVRYLATNTTRAPLNPAKAPPYIRNFLTQTSGNLLGHGINVTLGSSIIRDPKRPRFVKPEFLRDRGLAGLLSLNLYDLEFLASLKEVGCPVVALDTDASQVFLDSVSFDHLDTAFELVRALYGRGCRRIAYVSGPFTPKGDADRLAYDPCAYTRSNGWRLGMRACGLKPADELVLQAPAQGGRIPDKLWAKLLAARPDGIVTDILDSVIKCMSKSGTDDGRIRLAGWTMDAPEKQNARLVSAIAFCDSNEMSKRGARILVDRIEGKASRIIRSVIPADVRTIS